MALLSRVRTRSCNFLIFQRFFSSELPDEEFPDFTKLNLMNSGWKKDAWVERKRRIAPMRPPRSTFMPVDQHWPSVWPTAASFRPSAVPLPLCQGLNKDGPPPGKNANLELQKIPNFLHLTPPAIKAHCAAIKKFCSAWPKELKDREGFPLEIITSDYCHSGPSIRDPKARIVTLIVKLSDLGLPPLAADKLKRLLEKRYDRKTDMITLVADRCPRRKQNQDYLMYLLTALYHESQKHEAWEDTITESDWFEFKFDGSQAQKEYLSYLRKAYPEAEDGEILNKSAVKQFGDHLTELMVKGESSESLQKLKSLSLPLLQLEPLLPQQTLSS